MKAWSFKKSLTSVLAVGVSLSLIGCTATKTTTTTSKGKDVSLTQGVDKSKAPPAVHTDTVTIQYPTGMTSLDTSQWAAQILVDQGTTFEGLYGYDQTNKIVPKIATGATVSADKLTWTISLRKDAKWSNGDPVTANDFYYAWMRMLDPSDSNGAIWEGLTNIVKNGWEYHGGAVKADQVGLKVVDDYTLQISTGQPSNILPYLALTNAMPLDKKATEAHPKDWWLPANFVTDGPYKVKSFVQNGKVELEKNPNYVPGPNDQQNGNIKNIVMIPTPTTPVETFMSKKIDVVQIGQPSDLKYVDSHPDLKAQLQQQPNNSVLYLEFDKAPAASPLDNQKVRQAIAEAIQRDPIAQNVMSNLVGSTNVFGSPEWAPAQLEKGISYNAADAKKLLSDAGYPDGKGIPDLYLYTRTKTDDPNQVNIAMALAQELKQTLGINFKIVPEPSTQYGAIVWSGQLKGIHPGYVLASGAANWDDASQATLQGDQAVLYPGTFVDAKTRQHIAPWYDNAYNPQDVALWGDPNNNKAGLSQADWAKLDAAAKKTIPAMNAWIAKQPQPYQSELKPLVPYEQQWKDFYDTWKSSKDAATKHQNWVNAWKFLGSYSTGVGNSMIGLADQLDWDTNQSQQEHDWRMLQTELKYSTTADQSNQLAAQLDSSLIQSGFDIPLFYVKTVFLERNGITGAQANPWAWGNFYQFQYLNSK